MSSIADYEDVSNSYDTYRRASNMDLIISMTTFLTGKSLKDMSILDAGCGTGNYSLGLLGAGAGHVTMMDASPGMLDKARQKTEGYDNVVEFTLGKLPQLPFPDNSFDVVIFMQVLHHLDTSEGDERRGKIRDSLSEAVRVVRTGGVIVVDTCTPEQCDAIWYYRLMGVGDVYSYRLPPLSLLRDVLQDGGCSVQSYVQPERCLMDYAKYSDLEGALQPSWRRSDSSFQQAKPEMIEEFCGKIRRMKDEGTLQEYFEECEKDRFRVGHATTMFARKF